MTHDIIISYATTDKPIADAICAKLEERGIRCWIAPRDILASENYGEAIIDAIDCAKLMVLVFSSNANLSKHVMREAERAVHDGIPIIPFRIEDVEPTLSLQYYISAQHWLDALTPPLEEHILKLAETVSVLLNEPIPTPTQGVQPKSAPPSPAPLSKRVTRLPSQRVLLIGAIIIIAAAVSVGYYSTTLSTSTPIISNEKAAGNQTIFSSSRGYSITYPNTLKTDYTTNSSQPVDLYVYLSSSSKIDAVVVATSEQTSGSTLQDFVNSNRAGIQSYPNYQQISSQNTTLAGKPAYNIIYQVTVPVQSGTTSGALQNMTLKIMQTYLVNYNTGYVITYKTTPGDYDTYLAQAQQIINSFKLT